MKIQIKRPITIVIFVFLLLFSCATSQQIQKETDVRVIDMGSFTVNQPSGEGWGVRVFKEKGVVQFTKEEGKPMRVFGQIMTGRTKLRGLTLIQINSYIAPPQNWNLDEEKMADEVRKQEENNMIEKGVKEGLYELKDVKNNTEIIGGRKLYFMSYKATVGTPFLSSNPKATEAVIYFYFPKDFERSHNFYSFLISTSYIRGHFVKVDLTQIHPVINSFQIINPLTSPENN